ncbi:MAG: DEAD/DEAH box helicase [Proteobacteria bacterium]|nr:DEAD/DEAH box helicase [Pseudomonadota bacterium]
MSPISVELDDSYENLLIEDIRAQLPGNPFDSNDGSHVPTELDISRLLSAASALALSSVSSDRAIAYSITTRLLDLHSGEFPILIPLAAELLARLGNFPARTLLERRYGIPAATARTPLLLALESLVRFRENTVQLAADYEEQLTDFQFEFLTLLQRSSTSSVSAPTSAGKSFVLGIYIQQLLQSQERASIVYVVPTRALIRQVLLRIVKFLNRSGLSDVPVRSVPLPLDTNEANGRIVYVLTQERLLSLLFSDVGEATVTSLIIDEAQGLAEGGRGVILQTAIDVVLQKFPGADLHFASPLSANPEFLPRIFKRANTNDVPIALESPVTQNIIHVNSPHGHPRQPVFTLQLNGKQLHIDQRVVDFPMTYGSAFERRARFARAITRGRECTIVYADGPSGAEKTAKALVSLEGLSPTEDREVLEFAEFLREHIHRDYPLVNTLRHACAFHYGFMPQIVRSRVEELFTLGKLRFICCTSTLLQGVNLPAKHIVLENPQRGKGQPMDRPSFLNLAGRAGRLLQEFQGNVWCLNSKKWDLPKGQIEPSYSGEQLSEIRTAFGEVLATGAEVVRRILDGERMPRSQTDLATTALGRIFVHFVRENRQSELIDAAPNEMKDQIREIIRRCEGIDISLDRTLLRRNWTVSPSRLQELYDYLSDLPNLEELIPLDPWRSGSNLRLREIFRIVDKILAGSSTEQYLYYSTLAFKWVHEEPLGKIIRDDISYRKKNRRFESAARSIYDLMKNLEQEIRYRYVKQVRAYMDILNQILVEKGELELSESIAPLHLFLECGASSIAALSLLSIGLTRTTSLLLRRQIEFPEDATPEQCRTIIRSTDISELDIPSMCKRELQTLVWGSVPVPQP